MLQEFLRYAGGLVQVAATDAQRAIHHRRIVENESFLRGWCAVRIEDCDFGFEESSSELAWISDRRGATDELRIAAVEAGDAAQAAQHVAQMAAENTAVGVQLIEDDVAEVFEQARPARVMREDAGVQHVRIGQDDVPFFADGSARVGGSVAVISENAEAIVETLVEIVEFGELVLREGLGGEEVERAAIRIFEGPVQYRQVIAQSFAGGRGRDNDDIFSGVDGFGCLGLMSVEVTNAFGGLDGGEIGMHPGREVRPLGLPRRKMAHGGEEFTVVVVRGEGIKHFADAGYGSWHGGASNGK